MMSRLNIIETASNAPERGARRRGVIGSRGVVALLSALFPVLVALSLFSWGSAVTAALPDDELAVVSGFVKVSAPSGARYSRRTGTYNAYVEVENVSGQSVLGPVRVAVSNDRHPVSRLQAPG